MPADEPGSGSGSGSATVPAGRARPAPVPEELPAPDPDDGDRAEGGGDEPAPAPRADAGSDDLAPTTADRDPATARPVPDRRRRVLLTLAAVLAVIGMALIGLGVAAQRSAPAGADLGALEPTAPVRPAQPPAPAPAPAAPAPPVRVQAPDIRLDSTLTTVGLNPDQTMEVPGPGATYDLAAWYRYSVPPGARGPTVIVGHVDSLARGPSVFFELGAVRPGQTVEVDRADGVRVPYTVYATRTYPKDAFATGEVYGPTPGPELRLITCGGSFDATARSYRDDTVVFARVADGPAPAPGPAVPGPPPANPAPAPAAPPTTGVPR